MLQIQNLNYSIGERDLLKQVNWTIHPGRRIALVGANGAGKTTLLRILCGEIEITEKVITRPREYSIGYLPQEESSEARGNVLQAAMEGHEEILNLEAEIESIHEQLEAQSTVSQSQLEKLGQLEERYNLLGGYELESLTKKILMGLGFTVDDFIKSVSTLSGGWRMRVHLARLLLQQPDLLLLDEPTNHLDLPSLEWLENYLKNFPGSIIIVTHDRFFIDRLAQEIVEIQMGRLTHYAGNYHFFERKKALDQEQLIKRYEEQKEERERLEKFINRFRYKATKAVQVQSRIKRLEKMEVIEIPPRQRTIRFSIKADVQSYKEVLAVDNLWFRYENPWVLQDISLRMYRGEKTALVGINGVGKTTFTRLISKELTPQRGQLVLGQRVHTGYYAQHQIDVLNLNKTIYEEVASTAAPSFQPKLRDILGLFQFSNDDILKRIGVLSGGEKARVSLAKILLSPSNFLIMDEPTNHLDAASRASLEKALLEYDGTLLLISHDRYFLDKLVNRVIEIKDGTLKEYNGSYSHYLEKREAEEAAAEIVPAAREDKKPIANGNQRKTKEQKQQEAAARQKISKERRRLTEIIESAESRLEILAEQKNTLEQQLADPQTYGQTELFLKLQKEYDAVLRELPKIESAWENAQLELEELLSNLQT